MDSDRIETFWQSYLDTLPEDSPIRAEEYVAEGWGDSPQLADELGALIAAGTKTATCSALWEYESEGSPLPEPGSKTVVLDGNGDPLCIVETTEVEVRPYDAVDSRFAYEEGEGGSFAGVLAGGTLAFFLAYPAEHRKRTGNGHAAGVRTVPRGVQVGYEREDTILESDELYLDQ